ncbi:MAG: response regulator transcription factor [Oligoflexales bacterium]
MKTVVIIDDSHLIRKQLKKFFEEKMDLKVVAQGEDGEQAISIYRKFTPDLLTMDLEMPNKSGLEATEEIIKFDSKARILVISSNKEDEKITKALNLGAKGFIFKPLQFLDESFVDWVTDEVNDALSL